MHCACKISILIRLLGYDFVRFNGWPFLDSSTLESGAIQIFLLLELLLFILLKTYLTLG